MTGTDIIFAEALRFAANIVDDVDEVADVRWMTTIGGVFGIIQDDDRRAALGRVARTMKLRALGGKVDKRYVDGDLRLDADCGARVKVTVSASMVCEAVVVGREVRTVQKVTQPAVVEQVEEEVDVVEWRCGDPILDAEVGR